MVELSGTKRWRSTNRFPTAGMQIQKVRKKDGQHHWIIDPKHTVHKHNKHCLLGTRQCPGVITVEKRILKNLETARAFTDRKTHGREVMSSIQVNSQVKVTSVHSKRAWKEGNGADLEVFRESFTRLEHLINYLDSARKCAATVFLSDARDELQVRKLRCQLEQTHVCMWALAALWYRMQARSFGVGEVSRTSGGKEWCEDGSRWVSRNARAFCGWQPTVFLVEVFI